MDLAPKKRRMNNESYGTAQMSNEEGLPLKRERLDDEQYPEIITDDQGNKPENLTRSQLMQLFLSHLTTEQLDRYEIFRRSSFSRAMIRRIMMNCAGSGVSITPNVVIAMAGITKIYLGEIIEKAIEVKTHHHRFSSSSLSLSKNNNEKKQQHFGHDNSPLRPEHILTAIRQLNDGGFIENASPILSSFGRGKVCNKPPSNSRLYLE